MEAAGLRLEPDKRHTQQIMRTTQEALAGLNRVKDAGPLYLVSCVGKKREYAMPAKDLYASEWFVRARGHVERNGGRWFILSAKFGLVAPEQCIEPYEQTLNAMAIAERRTWAQHVRMQMDALLPTGGRCVVLAGQRYREFLMDYLSARFTTDVPMVGLAIGQQLRWLATH